ncbi:methyltransferase domain-containing protein [Chryseobacterium sp.]|uniref:methyltransferase domain-containing protein n=1 Tax=Chryseobacterium sp. TaxID=1871047 RepID=UPI00289A1B1F|nr:methyltransferase domain-containing protein [Chryseobacterium sp.]
MEQQSIIAGFQQVDHSQHQFLMKFLEDVADQSVVKQSLELQIKLLDAKPGDHLLDVGCGIGIQAKRIAEEVAPTGKFVGTDMSNVMIELAKERTADLNLPIEFYLAEAGSQPFPDESFDGIRTERVLMYISDTQKVFQEFMRLLKPGGRLVVFDFHWDGSLISHKDKVLTRKIIQYTTDSFPNGYLGTDLHRQLRNVGFQNINIQPYNYSGTNGILFELIKRAYGGILQSGVENGTFTQHEIDNWWQALEDDAETGNFFVSLAGIIAYGIKG